MEKNMRNNCFENVEFYFVMFQNENFFKLNLTLEWYN